MDSPARVQDLEKGNGDSQSTRIPHIVTQQRLLSGPLLPKWTLLRGRAFQVVSFGKPPCHELN
jgi:hypothetical protein